MSVEAREVVEKDEGGQIEKVSFEAAFPREWPALGLSHLL